MQPHPRPHDDRTHPPPHLPTVSVAGAAALVAALLATGCEAKSTATTTAKAAAFSTVRFTLGPTAGIRRSGASRATVTPAGAYPVSAGRAHPFVRPDGKLLVVLRHRPEARAERASRGRAPRLLPPEESAVGTGFLVDTANWAQAALDGHPLQWLRRDTIRIDTTNNAPGDLTRLTLSGPHGGRSGQPTPPPDDRACNGLDAAVPRRVVLPEVAQGASVPETPARLRRRCLDVQFASTAGGVWQGTVLRIAVPIAGRPTAAAVIPPFEGTAVAGRMPGDTVLADLSRPSTVAVTR